MSRYVGGVDHGAAVGGERRVRVRPLGSVGVVGSGLACVWLRFRPLEALRGSLRVAERLAVAGCRIDELQSPVGQGGIAHDLRAVAAGRGMPAVERRYVPFAAAVAPDGFQGVGPIGKDYFVVRQPSLVGDPLLTGLRAQGSRLEPSASTSHIRGMSEEKSTVRPSGLHCACATN